MSAIVTGVGAAASAPSITPAIEGEEKKAVAAPAAARIVMTPAAAREKLVNSLAMEIISNLEAIFRAASDEYNGFIGKLPEGVFACTLDDKSIEGKGIIIQPDRVLGTHVRKDLTAQIARLDPVKTRCFRELLIACAHNIVKHPNGVALSVVLAFYEPEITDNGNCMRVSLGKSRLIQSKVIDAINTLVGPSAPRERIEKFNRMFNS